jgi:hypothetical protein
LFDSAIRSVPRARLDVLLGRVLREARELAGELRAERVDHRRDRDLVVAHADAPGHLARVDPRGVGRVARRHHHRMDAIGPERVDRHRERQRRVDATRQSDDRAGESVLAEIVVHAEHERAIDLLGERQVGQHGRGTRHRAVEVEHLECLDEVGHLRHDAARRVEHERAAVEDEFVLAADEIRVDERESRDGHVGAHHVVPLRELLHVVRRRVRNQEDLRPRVARGARRVGEPAVLADDDAEARALDVEDERRGRRREVALLVEHVVVG